MHLTFVAYCVFYQNMCDHSEKMFSTSSSLEAAKEGTAHKPYECDICNKRLSRKWSLKRHKRTLHTREKPYECDVCNKRFSRKGNLNIHKRTHTGDKPYECDVCKKRFSYLTSLVQHKRTHTRDKPLNVIFARPDFPVNTFSKST